MWGLCLQAQRSLIRTYTVGDGLVMNRVRGFHQDRDGFIWMLTWDGLSRYEGYRFRNYIAGRDLQHSFVNDMYEYPDGHTYLALNDGTVAIIRNQEVGKEVLNPGYVINHFFNAGQGVLYASTDNRGICRFENKQLIPLSENQSAFSIDDFYYWDHHFYFIGPHSGPSGVFDEKMNFVADWKWGAGYFSCIHKDQQDRFFLGTLEGLKEVVRTAASDFDLIDATIVPAHAAWKNWSVTSITSTDNNEYWIGTNQGLVQLRADGTWSVITVEDGLLSNQINCLFIDRAGTLWIGTDAGAASINLQNEISHNRSLNGVAGNYLLPGEDGSVFVLGGYTYLHHVDRRGHQINSFLIGSEMDPVMGFIPHAEKLLLLRSSSLEPFNGIQYKQSGGNTAIPALLYVQSKNKKWWLSYYFGFQCNDGAGPSLYVKDAIYGAQAVAIDRHDRLLIGTLDHGLFVAETTEGVNQCTLKNIKDLTAQLGDTLIRSLMVARNGDIWVGTRYAGVIRLQCDSTYTNCHRQQFTINEGLISNWITVLLEDQHNNIWIGSASGIDKIIPKGDQYRVFSFSRINGFYGHVRHLIVHEDGTIWVGHSEGLSRIVDGHIDTIPPPDVYITEAHLGGNSYPSYSGIPARLPHDQNSVHFAFAAPDYINASQLTFNYRLLGSGDTTWSVPTRTHEIYYGTLNPGKYRFEVAAYGWNGQRGTPAGYSFVILRPFWLQTWFILLGIVAVVVATYSLFRFRIVQMHRVQSVRDRIAADLHDEIGSSLTHINILSEIGRQHQAENNGASSLFERIGAEVQTSSEALDDIIWSVKTKRDAIGDIIARMRQYATEIFEPAGIVFQLNDHVEGIQSLEMEFKRDFYLVYKELLRNVLRHAEATQVDIMINADRSRVSMQIADNGKGFNIKSPSDRSGLSNVHARVKKWGGQVKWNSDPGKGTQVSVEMKPG